jgi:hypothetical protein
MGGDRFNKTTLPPPICPRTQYTKPKHVSNKISIILIFSTYFMAWFTSTPCIIEEIVFFEFMGRAVDLISVKKKQSPQRAMHQF